MFSVPLLGIVIFLGGPFLLVAAWFAFLEAGETLILRCVGDRSRHEIWTWTLAGCVGLPFSLLLLLPVLGLWILPADWRDQLAVGAAYTSFALATITPARYLAPRWAAPGASEARKEAPPSRRARRVCLGLLVSLIPLIWFAFVLRPFLTATLSHPRPTEALAPPSKPVTSEPVEAIISINASASFRLRLPVGAPRASPVTRSKRPSSEAASVGWSGPRARDRGLAAGR